MGNEPSKPEGPEFIMVIAPKTMNAGEFFDVKANGAYWKGLQVSPDDADGVTKGEKFKALCDCGSVKIDIKSKESAKEGEDFLAGEFPFEWTIDEAPAGGVQKGDIVTVDCDDILSKKKFMFKSNIGDQMKIPSKEYTGVDTYKTEICASLSKQIYQATTKKHFKLESSTQEKADIIIFDNHGGSDLAIPAFAVAVIDQTLICAWRGTNGILDAVTDIAIGPVSCAELGTTRSGIRMQNAMMSFAAMELDTHKDEIISLIETHNINEIIFTGHSLGGGIAYCAHPILQAQMDGFNDSSSAKKWEDLNSNGNTGSITLRTVVFSAPMSLYGIGSVVDGSSGTTVINNEDSNTLLDKVGKTTVNLMYGCDIVPRGYSHYEFAAEVLNAVGNEDLPEIINKSTPIGIGWVIQNKVNIANIIRRIKEYANEDVVPAVKNFRHVGSLLYYKDQDALSGDPLVLTDTGPIEGKKTTNETEFNHYTYASHVLPEGKTNFDALYNAHFLPIDRLASYLSGGSVDLADLQKDFFADETGQPSSSKKQKS